jgi:hypothetical protein
MASFYIPESSGSLYRVEQWVYAAGIGAAGICLFGWLAGILFAAHRGEASGVEGNAA